MKEGDQIPRIEGGISEINHLVKVLGMQVEKLDEAYKGKDPVKFNIIKKQILELQRKIQGLVK